MNKANKFILIWSGPNPKTQYSTEMTEEELQSMLQRGIHDIMPNLKIIPPHTPILSVDEFLSGQHKTHIIASDLTFSMKLESARNLPAAVPPHKWFDYYAKIFDKLRQYEINACNPRPIDRDYAMFQIQLAIDSAKSDSEREQFSHIRDFLSVLPSPDDMEQLVKCTTCQNCVESTSPCQYAHICDYNSPIDKAVPRHARPCYTTTETASE